MDTLLKVTFALWSFRITKKKKADRFFFDFPIQLRQSDGIFFFYIFYNFFPYFYIPQRIYQQANMGVAI